MTIPVSAGITEILFLRDRLQIDIAKLDRAAFALQANRAVRRIAVDTFVLKQAIVMLVGGILQRQARRSR